MEGCKKCRKGEEGYMITDKKVAISETYLVIILRKGPSPFPHIYSHEQKADSLHMTLDA